MTHPQQPQQQQEQQQEPQLGGADEEEEVEYERALAALSGLISGRQRRDSGQWAHAFEMMQSYLEVRPACPPACLPLVAAWRCLSAACAWEFSSTQAAGQPASRPAAVAWPPPMHAPTLCCLPLQRLGLDSELPKLSVIHVAGTKGKGSTCAMVERMLRQAGYRTGLFTSPHLIDVRERIRINGWVGGWVGLGGRAIWAVNQGRQGAPATGAAQQGTGCCLLLNASQVSIAIPAAALPHALHAVPRVLPPPLPAACREPVDRATFLRNLWWCFDRLEEKASDDSGKPAYFRFLTLLGGWVLGRGGVGCVRACVGVGWGAGVRAWVTEWQCGCLERHWAGCGGGGGSDGPRGPPLAPQPLPTASPNLSPTTIQRPSLPLSPGLLQASRCFWSSRWMS